MVGGKNPKNCQRRDTSLAAPLADMSSIYKLSICGVRLFDPERSETIEFGFPLTLICGQNGCGKTTIIECLKYATTGDLPPNSKGGAFVHDPKLVFKSEVRAQVKLAFANASGKLMICTRSMQLAKRRGRTVGAADTTTFKSLEGQLAIMNKGERSTISTKNAELDAQIPLYLGASKSVLDYVIFCHQDDSLWPLSEASILKKRFDDIFEALKYTRVLENLKVIRKDMTGDIKLIEQSVMHFKIDKERAGRLQAKLKAMQTNIDSYTNEIAELTTKIDRYEAKADKLFKSNQEFQEVLSKLQNLNMTQNSYRDQISRLESSIERLPHSDEELIEQLTNFERQLEAKRIESRESFDKLAALKSDLRHQRDRHNTLIKAEGTLAAKQEAYVDNLTARRKLMESHRDCLQGDDDPEVALGRIEQMLEQQTQRAHAARLDHEAKELALTDELKAIANTVSTLQEQRKRLQRDIIEYSSEVSTKRARLDELKYNEGNLEVAKAELQSLTTKLAERRTEHGKQDLQVNTTELNRAISRLEIEADDLNRKIGQANKRGDLHAKLALLKENKSLRQVSLDKLVSFHQDAYFRETGKKLDATGEDPETVVGGLIDDLDARLQTNTPLVDSAKSELSLATAREAADIQRITKLNSIAAEQRKFILEVIDEDQLDEYEKLLAELESDYRAASDALNTIEVTRQFNIKAIEIAEKEKLCSLCYRPFSTPELLRFVSLLQEKVNKMSPEALQIDCEQSRRDLESAKSINSTVLQHRKTIAEIKALEAQNASVHAEVTTLKQTFDSRLSEFNRLKSQRAKIASLQRPSSDIHRTKQELKALEEQIREFEAALSDSSYGDDLQSVSELQALQQEKNQQIKTIRYRLDGLLETKYANQKELARMESNIKDKRLAISDLEKSLLDRINLEHSIKDVDAKIAHLKVEVQGVELELLEEEAKQEKESAELSSMKEQHRDTEREMSLALGELDAFAREFRALHESIANFLRHDKIEYESIHDKMRLSDNTIRATESEIDALEATTKQLDRLLNESANTQANIRLNLELRHLQKEIDEVEQEIEDLDVANAESKRDEYQQETKRLRGVLADANAQYAGKVGEVRQMEDQIKSLKAELESEYKDVDKSYNEEWVKLQTNMLVSNDLQTYSKALDNAIMKFHSIKMEEINRIIDELWKQTYRGSDVDAIAIKSDVNVQAKGNRSYNYRVVMYKLGAELDMRGRCSAGQKVLACIIIRLALAECFGVNCGMIALDEPTTNLDVDNIESLAEALNNIIEVRKRQKNFQLIIITHDEKFLSHINGDKFTDHFYRVQRDDLQRSTIRSLPISLIQEE